MDEYDDTSFDAGTSSANLPLGRVGQPYRAIIDADFFSTGENTDYWFEGLEETGLHFVPEKKQITGVPKQAGRFEIRLNIRKRESQDNEQILSKTWTLMVEDDFSIPLEDMPSDENDPYWKPDEEVAIRIIPVLNRGWKKEQKKTMAAASKRGREHIREGKFREDDFDMKYDLESRWYIMAVADGSGKSRFSRKGSQIACESAVDACYEQLVIQTLTLDSLVDRLDKESMLTVREKMANVLHLIIESAVVKAVNDIRNEASENGNESEDYATTLLLCICKKYDFGWLIGTFWVGDGAICVYNKETWQTYLMGIPDGGDWSPPKRFLTMPEIVEPDELSRRIRFVIVEDFSALFLMTNGVSDPKFKTDDSMLYFENWNRFWTDISAEVNFSENNKNTGEELLKWLDFWSPGKHDDRTIAVLF